MRVLIPLADGLEEIEAVTIVDVLRRAEIEVTTSTLGHNPVSGSHGIAIKADTVLDDIKYSEFGSIVLPGGMPGSKHLKDDKRVVSLVQDIYKQNGIVAALCAAPMVLGHAGILEGKKATCYPGFEHELIGAEYIPEPVIADDTIITGKGPGCAIPFALKLVEVMKNQSIAQELKEAMQVYWM